MPYKDPAKARECKARYRQRNPERLNEESRIAKEKDRLFRRELLEDFPCICCGEVDNDLIQWHHVVPEEKSFGIVAGNSYSHDSLVGRSHEMYTGMR